MAKHGAPATRTCHFQNDASDNTKDMSAQNCKRTMQIIFAELANGNGQPFVDAMHDDFAWTISGQGPWARTWRGKDAVRAELFRPLFAQFATKYRNTAKNFIAEGDTVVVECKGDVATKQGNRYDNDYCYVCRFGDDGKLIALTEYMDTALAERVLAPPQ
jgi:ketosteroid isomerase-like protein